MAQNPTAGLGAGAIAEARPPGGLARNPIAQWLRANLFNTWINSAITLVVLYFAIKGLWSFIDWAFLSAHFEVDDTRVAASSVERGADTGVGTGLPVSAATLDASRPTWVSMKLRRCSLRAFTSPASP